MQHHCYIVILQRKGEVDEDGFFEGDLNGRVGLVPSNMVELIADTEELAKIHELLQAQKESTGTCVLWILD